MRRAGRPRKRRNGGWEHEVRETYRGPGPEREAVTMGYTTEFIGRFGLNKKLDDETFTFLTKLSATRRMKRDLGPEYGVEGEFYVDGGGDFGQAHEASVVSFNEPPGTQPSLWCQWVPTEDRIGIEWNEAEKFYDYVEWLEYLIEKVLEPRGYVLNGDVEFQGEEVGDHGVISVNGNLVAVVKVEVAS